MEKAFLLLQGPPSFGTSLTPPKQSAQAVLSSSETSQPHSAHSWINKQEPWLP